MTVSSSVLLNRLQARVRVRHLQVLVQVVELGSLRRAADAIGLTQPAVTHVVSDLEALVGAPLFQRHARGVVPLPLALELLPVARRMLAALADGAEWASARLQGAAGRVRVAATTAALCGLLSEHVPAFAEAEPGIQVQVLPAEGDRYAEMIARGEVDAVACRRPAVLPVAWGFHELVTDGLVVVCGPKHPLARCQEVPLERLAGESWLVPPAENLARQALERLFAQQGWVARIAPVVTRALPMTWALLQYQTVVALLPASVVRQLVDAGQLVVLPVGRTWPLDSLGMLVPAQAAGDATTRLLRFLQVRAA